MAIIYYFKRFDRYLILTKLEADAFKRLRKWMALLAPNHPAVSPSKTGRHALLVDFQKSKLNAHDFLVGLRDCPFK
jgi:hypothetical protein